MPKARERHPEAGSFAVVFVAGLVLALADPAKPFFYDSGLYWVLADSFTKGGGFSLLNFDNPLRGYLLPLVNHGLDGASGILGTRDSTVVKVPLAALFAVISTVLLPRLGQVIWPTRAFGVVSRLVLGALLLTFWRGYLAFPLSDFPALAAALLALVAVARSSSPGWALIAGLSAGAAINARPAYVLLAPAVLLLFLWEWRRDEQRSTGGHGRRVLGLALVLAGLLAVSLPQSLATHRHHGSYSPIPGSTADLSKFQLTVGLRLQRYETYVGDDLPRPQLEYLDGSTTSLLAELPDGVITGYGAYFGLLLDHPLQIGGVFVRHVVNGMDQRYTTPYVEELDTGGQRPLRLVGFTIVFLALLRLAWPAARRSLGPTRWPYALALLAGSATSIPAAMETRFLLPVYAFCYLLVAAPGWPVPTWRETRLRRLALPAAIAVAYVAFMAIAWTIVSAATDQLALG